MIKRTRMSVQPLPTVPEGSQFIIGHNYGKIDEIGHLNIWSPNSKTWVSKEKTLEEFNDYYIKDTHEFSLRDYVKEKYNHRFDKDFYFYHDQVKDKYYSSYNQPVVKGWSIRNGVKTPHLRAGEVIEIRKEKYPQIVKAIDILGVFSLYEYEESVREKFEAEVLQRGEVIPNYSKEDHSYWDGPFQNKFNKYLEDEFYKLTGVVLTHE